MLDGFVGFPAKGKSIGWKFWIFDIDLDIGCGGGGVVLTLHSHILSYEKGYR